MVGEVTSTKYVGKVYTNNTKTRHPDPDPHVFALPVSGSGPKGKEMNK